MQGRGCILGRAHRDWRQRIGNAVPPPAAEAIAQSCARTLQASADGSFLMSSTAVWVRRDVPEVERTRCDSAPALTDMKIARPVETASRAVGGH